MRKWGNLQMQMYELLKQSPFTYGELAEILNVDRTSVTLAARRLRDNGYVKSFNGAGNRQVLYASDEDEQLAKIDSLGKYSIMIMDLIEREGPTRTIEINDHANVHKGEARPSLKNLVLHGYLKRKKTTRESGYLYFVPGTEKEIQQSRNLGSGEEKVYKILLEKDRPMTPSEIGSTIGMSTANAFGRAQRLSKSGLISKIKNSHGSPSPVAFYTNPFQEKMAKFHAASPRYGIQIYGVMNGGYMSTSDVSERIGISRDGAFQALAKIHRHGLIIRKRDGKITYWKGYSTADFMKSLDDLICLSCANEKICSPRELEAEVSPINCRYVPLNGTNHTDKTDFAEHIAESFNKTKK